MKAIKYLQTGLNFSLVFNLYMVMVLTVCGTGLAQDRHSVEHYKMLSTIEYTGQGQFKNQIESMFSVKKEILSDDSVEYFISTNDFKPATIAQTAGQQPLPNEVSFTIDPESRIISGADKDMALLRKINNQSIKTLKAITEQNIGKTWKQSFDLSAFGYSLPNELNLTLTAIKLETEAYGSMIAVRALSEPFVVKVVRVNEGVKDIRARIRAAYLFDSEIEDIYLSISVFEATTDISSSGERLRYEIATYKTDATGNAVDLTGLGGNFEKFARKVGLSRKSLKVEQETTLPRWARSEGLHAVQTSIMCAAMACEGGPNPVVTICMPTARTVALQSTGQLATTSKFGTISSQLVKTIPGTGNMKIAASPPFMGVGAGTAGVIAGGTAGAVAIAVDDDDDSARSPSSP